MGVKNKKKGKKVISFIIGILLMLSIIMSILSFSVKFIILNPNTYYKILYKKDIYSEIYNTINSNISYALISRGLSIDINKDIISKDQVKGEVKSFIGDTIGYLKTGVNHISTVNIDEYMETFDKNLNEFLKSSTIVIDSNTESELDLLREDVKKIIESELQIVNAEVISNSGTINKVSKIISLFEYKLYLIPVIASLALILILSIIWGKHYISLLQWIGNSFISAGLLVFLVFFSGYISKFYNYVLINTQYLKMFVIAIIQTFLVTLSLWGVYSIIIGLILIIPKVRKYIKKYS